MISQLYSATVSNVTELESIRVLRVCWWDTWSFIVVKFKHFVDHYGLLDTDSAFTARTRRPQYFFYLGWTVHGRVSSCNTLCSETSSHCVDALHVGCKPTSGFKRDKEIWSEIIFLFWILSEEMFFEFFLQWFESAWRPQISTVQIAWWVLACVRAKFLWQ